MSEKKEPRYIAASGRIAENGVNALAEKHITGGSMILMYTGRFVCAAQQEIADTEHLLEARIFTEQAELKIMRQTIGTDFTYRLTDDTRLTEEDYLDEAYFLDIDSRHSAGTEYTATGGGRYTLPAANAAKLRIRNYITYTEDGIAQITDFRAVRYLGGDANG